MYRKIPIRCRTTLNVGISKHTHKHYTQCRPNVDSDHSVFTKVYIECNFFCLEWVVKQGRFSTFITKGWDIHPPILTRKKEFDLSKRKHGPTIVPALSAKVDNKENDSFRLETHCSSPSCSTHSAPAAGFSISAWPWRATEGRISFFHKRTQKSTGSRLPACGSTSTSWKLPGLSESIPKSQHASQTDMNFAWVGSCRRHPFVRIPSWLL